MDKVVKNIDLFLTDGNKEAKESLVDEMVKELGSLSERLAVLSQENKSLEEKLVKLEKIVEKLNEGK